MGVLSNLEPKEVFEQFEALSQIPRRTYRDEKISDYCVEFAKSHGLEYVQDEVGNVVIYKDGTEGYEDSEPVILQGHMDMVASKTLESDHDFDNDPIEIIIDGDYIGAKDTTLGGDDGIALAYAMAILASDDIPHPPIEALFTIDEEIGMGGAHAFDTSLLHGRKLLNIDGEEDGVLVVGCAGGTVVDVVIPISRRLRNGVKVSVTLKGYQGGHSGNDIQRQRGNAIKDMGRVLHTLSKKIDFSLLSLLGGNAANVIAQYCKAEVVMSADRVPDFRARLEELIETIRSEYGGTEPEHQLKVIVGDEDNYSVLNWESTVNMIWYLYGAIDGVQAMDRNVEGAVESSLNTGIVTTEDTTCVVRYQARSSLDSKLDEMVQRLGLWSEIVGGHLEVDSSYPAWPYNPVSELRPLMIDVYKDMFGEEPAVELLHAGLEGGILMGKDPDLDIVNFGPEMLNVHTPTERLNIASAAKNWEYLKEVLRRLK